jgi:hypothetical protein
MSELQTLLDFLNGQRRHVLGILEGLSEEDLRRPMLPSGWSCLGMVRHLAIDDERFWFQSVVAGAASAGALGSQWRIGGAKAEEIFDLYRQECAKADAIIAACDLDKAPKWWPDHLFGPWRLNSVREVLLHVIAETACHAGHLDAARELIDGRQWIVNGG